MDGRDKPGLTVHEASVEIRVGTASASPSIALANGDRQTNSDVSSFAITLQAQNSSSSQLYSVQKTIWATGAFTGITISGRTLTLDGWLSQRVNLLADAFL